MLSDMNGSQEKAILTLMTKITSIMDLSVLLDVVVQELPSVLGARGCWIYLQADYVPKSIGVFRRGDTEITEAELSQKFEDFIVLAATNLDSKRALIGKAYFGSGEGITGWVYKNNKPLRVSDVTNEVELRSKSLELVWANEYQDGDELYELGEKRPLLAVPLILNENPIGTLKFHATLDKEPFSEVSEEISVIVSQIISGVLRQTSRVAEQSQTISRLIETSNKNTLFDVAADVTRSMKQMLSCTQAEYFMKTKDGVKLWLVARNGVEIDKSESIEVEKGESLIGWVFKTGLPLIIPNIKEYSGEVLLNNELLEEISVLAELNDDSMFIKYKERSYNYSGTSSLQAISFVAVPVKSKDQEIQGVLCGYRNITSKSRFPFDRTQLILASSFASTIALTIENEKQKVISNLLTELGNLTETDQLFKMITDNLPNLVISSGCSIFTTKLRHGVSYLKLSSTSHKGLISNDGNIRSSVEYELGEGKTGVCGLFQSTLAANHYGKGKASHTALDQEIKRIKAEHPNDIADLLFDSSNNKVGLFHLWSYEKLPLTQRVAIHDFAKTIIVESTGMPSVKLDAYTGGQWSFVAIPITSDQKLLGVLTLDRSLPESPFLTVDISLLKSIAGRLASVMNNLRIVEQREKLLMSLAHEINTPITGILADSQNIFIETPTNTDLQKIAKHNLGQVSRLHMQASAIMAVLSEQESVHQFTKHSIFLPLKDACELFESEASQNGCNILGPKTQDGNFPTIEMCLFDLTIAFKNIVHNAVKYSFRPPVNKDIHRRIKVWGEWDKKRPEHYAIFVQNYGVGIKPHEITKRLIFEPYYRGENASDRKRTGTGFGLAHARLVIEDIHHGFIDVNSINQGGEAHLTTFSISLPVSQPKL